jgi:acetylornithine deacetylase/succinyl-diaminopimelate desuccinylase-like protein
MSAHEALGRWVDARHAEQVEFLRAIVRVPTDMPPGDNAPAAERVAELLTALGYEVERHPVPAAFLAGYGMKSVTNLIVRHRFGPGGPTIALNAHGDVVPPGEGWTRPPYEGVVEDGRMYGRGVAVSKSDIATYAYALAALRALEGADAPRSGSVELHFTYDEEYGGLAGPEYLLAHGLTRPDYAIAATSRSCPGRGVSARASSTRRTSTRMPSRPAAAASISARRRASTTTGSSSGVIRRSRRSVSRSGTTLVLMPPPIRPTIIVGWSMPGTRDFLAFSASASA